MRLAETISARQIRAARALLNWSQEDLAVAANVSIATVRKIEISSGSIRESTYFSVKGALESVGMEFLEENGVRQHEKEARFYTKRIESEHLIENMMRLRESNNEALLALVSKDDSYLHTVFMNKEHVFNRVFQGAKINCLIQNCDRFSKKFENISFRELKHPISWTVSFFVLRDAVFLFESVKDMRVILIRSNEIAKKFRGMFFASWGQ